MTENKTKRKELIKSIAIVFLAVLLVLTFFSNTIMNWSLPQVSGQYAGYGTITTGIRGSGVVTANIPPSFDLVIPIYKGSTPETVEVEFYATVNGRDILLSLYSPGAVAAVEDVRNNLIDDQINVIRDEFPELPIIEI